MHGRMIVAGLAVLWAGAAAAQDYPVATGPGLSTCERFTQLDHDDPGIADAFYAWAEGYMSGLNNRFLEARNATNLLPPNRGEDAQKQFLNQFCRAHPSETYMAGVVALFAALRHEQGLKD
jgi:hypothetical protein